MWFFKKKHRPVLTVRDLWQQHIPELLAGLYLRHIRQYPDWKDAAPEFMPESVTAIVQLEEGHEKMILNLHEYELSFKDWVYKTADGAERMRGLLEIFEGNGKKVFGLILVKADRDGSRWEAAEVEAFAPGPWLDDFKKLAKEIVAIIKEKKRESHEG